MPESRILFTEEETQEKLARLYRYSQVGHCVSSVTHDVNNFLGAILAYAELIGLEGVQTAESTRMLGEIMEAVRRSSRLIGGLTDIARRERPDIRVVRPREVVESVLDLRRYDLKVARVSVETAYAENLPDMAVDLPKLEQALIYLLSNAIEAVEGRVNGRLKISVFSEDERICFDLWNSGEVVGEDLRTRLFEPFFTTKNGDHLGLGLWAARRNLRMYGGDVSYDPQRGFSVTLPREAKTAALKDENLTA